MRNRQFSNDTPRRSCSSTSLWQQEIIWLRLMFSSFFNSFNARVSMAFSIASSSELISLWRNIIRKCSQTWVITMSDKQFNKYSVYQQHKYNTRLHNLSERVSACPLYRRHNKWAEDIETTCGFVFVGWFSFSATVREIMAGMISYEKVKTK